jgi:autotransporter-associated beta strand protein/T5SS/PEP-CTERM-associated repeat protein
VVSSNSFISYTATSSNNSILVTGSGGNSSTLSNIGTLSIGYAGSGSLTVAEGALVAASGGITIAAQAGSTGTLNIGSLGTNDTAGTIQTPTIAFGTGSGTINFNQTDKATATSTISGAGTVRQLGNGTTSLAGSNTYSGTTTVNSGTLLANNTAGSAVGTSVVTVSGNGTLGGNGSIGGATTIATGGTLTPGSGGVGSLTFTNGLTLQTGATTSFLVNATNNFTSINLIGSTLSYGGDLVFNITSYTPAAGDAFTLFNMTGGAVQSGDFTSVTAGALIFSDASGIWSATDGFLNYQFSDATGQLTVANAVPEPSTYALFGLGAIGLLMVLHRKKTA